MLKRFAAAVATSGESQHSPKIRTSRLQGVYAASADSFATKVGFARTFGVSSIRANSIRAIAIMTKAVETNRI
jgi:hypothetical protein